MTGRTKTNAGSAKPTGTRKKSPATEGSAPLSRVLAVLDLAAQLGMVSTSDLTYQLDLPRPTAHRLIASLEEIGLLQKMPIKGKYAMAPRMVKLAWRTLASTIVYAPLQTLLTGLAQRTGETCSVAVMANGEVEYIASVSGHSPLTLQFQAGQRAPLYCTSSGRVFLASLDDSHLDAYLSTGPWEATTTATVVEPRKLGEQVREVRKQGHALNDSEYISGVVGAAVPVHDHDDRLAAVLTISAPKSRKSLEDIRYLLPVLKNYAARISRLV